eukprot:TRINITY_DN316_c1_g3_i1.p1 TRINITY_DN316_c1_g3~~TRINITY_DN316_c1_g3_i1.p1  ORF type:complete len:421 (+),score=69.87 TRINITY_DN316_c1_g3_i1:904-2166(+)
MSEESDATLLDKRINSEYRIWKKNAPFLYDLVLTRALDWPSLTVEWSPEKKISSNREYSSQRLILGTHTASETGGDAEQNYLMLAEVKVPIDDTPIDISKYNEERGEIGGFGSFTAKVEIKIRINHPGEVNRARIVPQNPSIIATKPPSENVLLFDYRKHPSVPKDNTVKPELTLTGHTKEGFGLSWCSTSEGKLLSASNDASICMWDINGTPTNGHLSANSIFTSHTGTVNDVSWHVNHDTFFASVGDDGKLMIWDIRANPSTPSSIIDVHQNPVLCLSFNPSSDWFLATGGTEGNALLWDLRNLNKNVHSFVGHSGDVMQIQWSGFHDSILGTCGADRRVFVWDVSRVGREQTPEDKEDGPPELLFIHGGHTAQVSDFAWNPNDPWVCASVAEDNILQIWKMAENIHTEVRVRNEEKC